MYCSLIKPTHTHSKQTSLTHTPSPCPQFNLIINTNALDFPPTLWTSFPQFLSWTFQDGVFVQGSVVCEVQAKSRGVQKYFWLIDSFPSSKSETWKYGAKTKNMDVMVW